MSVRKKTKRGQNEGGCYQRKDGRWEASLTLETVNGKAKRRSFYGTTKAQAMKKLKAAQRQHEAGLPVATEKQTVGDFLERWLEDTVKPAKAPTTYASYAEVLRRHVIPALGRQPLTKLSSQHVAALMKTKTDAGLSPRRVHHIRAVLRNALNQAMRWGLVHRNVAALTEPPRQAPREVKPFSPAEVRALLKVIEGERLAALFRLALSFGLRQGEVLGPRWEDVDLDAGTLRVRHALQRIDGRLILKEPKSDKSRRALPLPASALAALKTHRVRQLEERLRAGERWIDTGLVFTTGIGTAIDPRNVIRAWHRLLAAHDLERRPFHTTRHTAASVLLAEGLPLKIVQEVLGHSLLSTTADIYAHLTPAAFREAADAMERALTASG